MTTKTGRLAGSEQSAGATHWSFASPRLQAVLDSFPGVTLLADEDADTVSMSYIEVPPEQQGQGTASHLMAKLKGYCDRLGKLLLVTDVTNPGFFGQLGWMHFQPPDEFVYSPQVSGHMASKNPEPTQDPDEEQFDDLYSNWSYTHDYDPRWDHSDELRPEWHQHPLIQAAQKHLDSHTGGGGRIFAMNLEPRDAVGMYAFGTGPEEPAIFIDPYQHQRHSESPEEAHDQVLRTVDHEYRHAQQEQESGGEPKWDEDDAENWRTSKETGLCPTCGDPLKGEFDTYCPRCQWTEHNPNIDSDPLSNPPDPTKDMHRGIQSSTRSLYHQDRQYSRTIPSHRHQAWYTAVEDL